MVIPEGAHGSFNIANFVVRIMSVDYQRNADPTRLPEDTQVSDRKGKGRDVVVVRGWCFVLIVFVVVFFLRIL